MSINIFIISNIKAVAREWYLGTIIPNRTVGTLQLKIISFYSDDILVSWNT